MKDSDEEKQRFQNMSQDTLAGGNESAPSKENKNDVLPTASKEDRGCPDDTVDYPSRVRLFCITLGIMAAVFMVALDNYIIATAIPKIAEDFHGLSAVGWYASSYFLTQMAFQPAFGRVYTNLSVKWMFILAMVIFEVGSIVCATAPSSAFLIVGRLVAGAGGAGLYVGTLTMAVHVVPLARRPFYLSLVTSMFGVASIAGPLLGGVFTESATLTWRFCFWINLPIGFTAAVSIIVAYKDATTHKRPFLWKHLYQLDLLGLLSLLTAFVCLIMALQNGGTRYPWSSPRIWACLLGFFLSLVLFILVQYFNQTCPSIPLHLISQRSVAACCIFILFMSMSVGSLIYYLPFYFQSVQSQDPKESGVDNLPFLVVMLFTPLLSGSIASMSGYYIPFMWIGPIISTIGSALLSRLSRTSSSAQVDAAQVLAGLGIGLCTQLPFTAVQALLPPELVVMASSMVSLCNSLGPVLGTNIAQSIFMNVLVKKLDTAQGFNGSTVVTNGAIDLSRTRTVGVQEIFASALARAYLVPTVCCGLAFLSSLFIRHVNIRQPKSK